MVITKNKIITNQPIALGFFDMRPTILQSLKRSGVMLNSPGPCAYSTAKYNTAIKTHSHNAMQQFSLLKEKPVDLKDTPYYNSAGKK